MTAETRIQCKMSSACNWRCRSGDEGRWGILTEHQSANDKGSPKAKSIDTKGLFSFGDGGSGGLNGRQLLDFQLAKYNVPKDSRLVVEFIIGTDGRVKRVLYPIGADQDLFRIAEKTIKSFRFNQVDDIQGTQKTKVTLIFKRK